MDKKPTGRPPRYGVAGKKIWATIAPASLAKLDRLAEQRGTTRAGLAAEILTGWLRRR